MIPITKEIKLIWCSNVSLDHENSMVVVIIGIQIT